MNVHFPRYKAGSNIRKQYDRKFIYCWNFVPEPTNDGFSSGVNEQIGGNEWLTVGDHGSSGIDVKSPTMTLESHAINSRDRGILPSSATKSTKQRRFVLCHHFDNGDRPAGTIDYGPGGPIRSAIFRAPGCPSHVLCPLRQLSGKNGIIPASFRG